MVDRTRKWSLATSADLMDLVSNTDVLNLLSSVNQSVIYLIFCSSIKRNPGLLVNFLGRK